MIDATTTPYPQRALRVASRLNIVLGLLLALALLLRLVVVLSGDQLAPYSDAGGDSGWYLLNGYALASGFDAGYLDWFGANRPVILAALPTPPLYLLFVGFWQTLLPPEAAVLVIRLLQALLSTATLFCLYHTARIVFADRRVGLLAVAVLAVHPAFVVESAQIATETLFIFLLAAGLWAYVQFVQQAAHSAQRTAFTTAAQREQRTWLQFLGLLRVSVVSKAVHTPADQHRLNRRTWALLGVAALLLALGTLTRAALLLFPLGLALHLLLALGWRRGLRAALLLLLVYTALASTWTIYNLAKYNRLVIGGEGFAAFLLYGALEDGWGARENVDAAVQPEQQAGEDAQGVLLNSAVATISRDPLGWARRRLGELANAYLQPHGTLFYGGASFRDLLAGWWQSDRSPGGLLALVGADNFLPKFALYALHVAALVLGLVGMWRTRAHWRLTLALVALIAYTTLLHVFLTVLPRYLFPLEAYWWLFAAAAVVRWRQSREGSVGTHEPG